MKKLFFVLLAAISLIACHKDGGDSLELTGGTNTSQTIYADETQKSEGIKFTAKEPWTATVAEVKAKSGNDVEWLKLSATEGGAGDFTISMTLTINTTGEDRKAEIKIISGGTSITIVVEQKGTTQSGEKPVDPEEPIKPVVTNYITQSGKVKGGEIIGKNVSTEILGSIGVLWGDVEELETTPVAYSNKTFDITLPTPADKYQGAFHPNLTITPSSTEFSYGNLEFNNGAELNLTNISWENSNNELYRAKKGEGYIVFVYASQDATIDGSFTDNGQVAVFQNCKVRKGWNEMTMIAAEDLGTNGVGTLNISINNSPADFKWVAVGDDKPVAKPQKVTKIETEINRPLWDSNDGSGSYGRQYVKSKTLFTYDSKDRVSKIEYSGEDTKDDTGTLTTYNFSAITNVIYAENSITIDHVSNGILEYREVATLANGKVTKIQAYDVSNGVATPDLSYTMSYVNDLLISTVVPRSDKNYKYTQRWKDGNVVELTYTTEGYYDSDGEFMYYDDKLNNKSNFDLSWLFLGELNEEFAMINAGGFLGMLGYCGQRTQNLVKVVEDGSTTYNVEYGYTNEYITTINITDKSAKKYVHKHKITY